MLFVFCFFINLVHCAGVVIAILLKEIDNSPYAKPCSSAITSVCNTPTAELKNAITKPPSKFLGCGAIYINKAFRLRLDRRNSHSTRLLGIRKARCLGGSKQRAARAVRLKGRFP